MSNEAVVRQMGRDAPIPGRPRGPVSLAALTTGGARAWGVSGEHFFPITRAVEALPAGLYEPGNDPHRGPFFMARDLKIDNLIDLRDPVTARIVHEITQFWELAARFAEFGMVHKRGVLMYGPPGTGKTAVAYQIVQEAIRRHNAIGVVGSNPVIASLALDAFRKIEPDRRAVVLLEDLDEILNEYDEGSLLALLDGEKQIDNVVYVATTNYPNHIPLRFANRPSRFDIVMEVGACTPEARAAFLLGKDPTLTESELSALVAASHNYTIAHLKELLVLVRLYGWTVKDAAKRLNDMRESRVFGKRRVGEDE